MKKLLLSIVAACSMFALDAQVGVNVLSPHPSAALQISSPSGTQRGLLTPSMTTSGRMAVNSGTNIAADGLVVYDTDHKMHYYFNAFNNRWISMSPLTLSTPTAGSTNYPSGVITTPASAATFSVGINQQNPTQALDVTGNAVVSGNITASNLTASGTVSGNSLSVNGYPINALVPAGTIVMWYGNSVPSGWTECNGNNGTPDLRGRFVVGQGQASSPAPGDSNPNYTLGQAGGENQHTLTKAELPQHFHEAKADGATISASGGSHYHDVTPNGQGTGESRSNGQTGGLANDSPATISTTSATHSHPNGEFGGKVGNGATDGLNNQPHENRPPYCALKFIMKL